MITLRTIDSAEPTTEQCKRFKQYASVPDEHRDEMLNNCLKRAMLEVQAQADTALLDCVFEMEVKDVHRGEAFKLYRGGVGEGLTASASFHVSGNSVVIDEEAEVVIVRYHNAVCTPELDRLMPVVWQYAVALYDGEDARVLAKILQQTYSC